MVITRIVPLPTAKLAGTLYGMIGLAVGAIVSIAALAGGFSASNLMGPLTGGLIGVGAIVVLPLLYGGMAFLMALLVSWLYNVAAGLVGGIEVDVK